MLENKEWDIIRSLANAGERDNPFIGDDCAFWREKNLFVTTDHMVEGHHFDLSFMPPETVGWRIMAANASDVISMGSKPTHFLLNIAIPSERYETGRKILEGIQKFAQTHGITLMGGDTTGGNSFSSESQCSVRKSVNRGFEAEQNRETESSSQAIPDCLSPDS